MHSKENILKGKKAKKAKLKVILHSKYNLFFLELWFSLPQIQREKSWYGREQIEMGGKKEKSFIMEELSA